MKNEGVNLKKLNLENGLKYSYPPKSSTNRKELEKKKIRKTIDENRRGERKVRVIPPTNQNVLGQTHTKLKVAAYCRVSSLDDLQMGSFEMQIHHFEKVIENNETYELVKIYADEGISGTSLHRRLGFQEMINDAKKGKIDLILTKSISRFGRNIVDIISTLRELEALSPPVIVNFESENILSNDGSSQLLITLLSAIAEMESQQKSIAIKEGIQYRMQEGLYKFSVKNIIGYYRDYLGQVAIEPAGAKIVQYIFYSFLEGASPNNIAHSLTEQNIPSPTGLERWAERTVKSILKNEKYRGDVLYQKTYSQNYLTHKTLKNNGILRQYYWTNVHPAIISEKKWDEVQELFKKNKGRRYKQDIKPMVRGFTVSKIKSGRLRGYYLLDLSWSKEEQMKFIEIINSEIELSNNEKEK